MLLTQSAALGLALSLGPTCLFLAALRHPRIAVEDGPIETVGAVLFAVSSAIAAGRALSGHLSKVDFGLCMLIAPFALLLALSEISFGARLGWLVPPAMYGGGEFDGGHDVVILTLRLIRDFPMATAPVLVLLIAGLTLSLWFAFRYRAMMFKFAMSVMTPMTKLFSIAIAGLVLALILDLFQGSSLSLLEEVIEFSVSVLLVLVVLTKSISLRDRYARDISSTNKGVEA